MPNYTVLHRSFSAKHFLKGSRQIEAILNAQATEGYRLHTMTTTPSNSEGCNGDDKIHVMLIFEKI